MWRRNAAWRPVDARPSVDTLPLQIHVPQSRQRPARCQPQKKFQHASRAPPPGLNRPRPTKAEGSEFGLLLWKTPAAVSSRPSPCSHAALGSTALADRALGLSAGTPPAVDGIVRRALRRYSCSRRLSRRGWQCEHPLCDAQLARTAPGRNKSEAGLGRGTLGRPIAGRCGLKSAALEPRFIAARQGSPRG